MNGLPIQTSVSGVSPLTVNGAKKRLVILTSGTQYVVPIGVYALEVEVIGRGFNGVAGGQLSGTSGNGGGAGGWALGLFPQVVPGQSFPISIAANQTWFSSSAELFANWATSRSGATAGGSLAVLSSDGQDGGFGNPTLNISAIVVVKLGAVGADGGDNVRGFGGVGGDSNGGAGRPGKGYGSGAGGGGTGILSSGPAGTAGPAAIFVWEYYL